MTTYRSLVIESLVQTVTANLAEVDTSSSLCDLNVMVTSLNGLSENFQIGTLSLNQCCNEIFRILVMSIEKYLAEIK